MKDERKCKSLNPKYSYFQSRGTVSQMMKLKAPESVWRDPAMPTETEDEDEEQSVETRLISGQAEKVTRRWVEVNDVISGENGGELKLKKREEKVPEDKIQSRTTEALTELSPWCGWGTGSLPGAASASHDTVSFQLWVNDAVVHTFIKHLL